jgi:hypothetical protein
LIVSIAAHGSLKLGQSAPTRAGAPVSPAPVSNDRPRQAPVWRSASAVALAPAAMSALIEAQENMGSGGTEFDRQKTAQKLDRLISRLDEDDPPPPPAAGAPFTLRRLQTARDLLV